MTIGIKRQVIQVTKVAQIILKRNDGDRFLMIMTPEGMATVSLSDKNTRLLIKMLVATL